MLANYNTTQINAEGFFIGEGDTRRIKSPNGLELNEQQSQFIMWAMEWLYQNLEQDRRDLTIAQKFRLLTGYPGVGKSTTVITLVALLQLAKLKVCLATPTHQAKEVLLEMALDNNVRVPVKTIYSLLGLRPEITDDGEEVFVKDPSVSSSIGDYDFIVLDESSMINKLLWTILSNTLDCPLCLCMGDIDQLRPVKSENKSPVFTKITEQFKLTLVMRHEGAIAQYVSAVRNSYNYVNPESYSNNTDLIYCDKFEWFSRLADAFEKESSVRAVAFKNATVSTLNSILRAEYYKRKLGYSIRTNAFSEILGGLEVPDRGLVVAKKVFNWEEPEIPEYLSGDKLLVKKPITEWSYLFNAKVMVIPNGARLTITRAEEWQLNDLSCYSLWVEWLDTKDDGSKELKSKLIYALAEHELPRFNTKLDELKNKALSFPAKSRQRSGAWKEYFKLKDSFADVQHHFASTIHKMQGTTLDYVFVYSDILDCRDPEMQRELNYVACSRARKQLVICR